MKIGRLALMGVNYWRRTPCGKRTNERTNEQTDGRMDAYREMKGQLAASSSKTNF